MGAWIETGELTKVCSSRSRTLYGCVDWNNYGSLVMSGYCVAPYMGAWIETYTLSQHYEETYVAPYMGAWIET